MNIFEGGTLFCLPHYGSRVSMTGLDGSWVPHEVVAESIVSQVLILLFQRLITHRVVS